MRRRRSWFRIAGVVVLMASILVGVLAVTRGSREGPGEVSVTGSPKSPGPGDCESWLDPDARLPGREPVGPVVPSDPGAIPGQVGPAPAKDCWLDVHVTDEETGAPLGDEVVYFVEARQAGFEVARTDPQGLASFGPFYPGGVGVMSARGGTASTELAARERKLVELTIPGGQDFTVLVCDQDGRPLQGADVFVWPTYVAMPRHALARTEPDGRAALTRVADKYCVAAAKDGYAASSVFLAHSVYFKGGVLEIVLRRGTGEVVCLVRDDAGRPLEGVEVILTQTSSLSAGAGTRELPVLPVGALPVGAVTDHDGRALFENVLGNVIYQVGIRSDRLVLMSVDYAPGSARVGRGRPKGSVSVPKGGRCLVEMRVATGGLLRLVAVDESGRPLPGALFRLKREGGVFQDGAFANQDGWCMVEPLAPGDYVIEASTGGGGWGVRQLTFDGDATCQITIEGGRRAGGRIQDPDCRPLPGWAVWIESEVVPGGRWPGPDAVSDHEGSFRFQRPDLWSGERLCVGVGIENGGYAPVDSGHWTPDASGIIVVPWEVLPSCWIDIEAGGTSLMGLELSGGVIPFTQGLAIGEKRTISVGPLPPGRYTLERLLGVAEREAVGEWLLEQDRRATVYIPE